jgi:glycosyltransferase involved in cell wall biosynthesis
MRARRILCCESHTGDPNWRWVAPALAAEPIEWEFFHRIPRTLLQRKVRTPDLALMDASRRCIAAARSGPTDLIVSHEPRTTFWCENFARLHRLDVPHVAHAFNYCYLPTGLRHRLMRKAFQRVDRFVTFSSVERDLYARHFGISPDKIEVVLWGVQPPTAAENSPHVPEGDYICALGGNRRDYRTLMAAMERLPDVRLVVVLRPHNLEGLNVPPNVTVRCMIPIPDAMAILKHSRFMVLPLDNGVVPCGHITMVSAMHMGKAFVATDSPGISDYAVHDRNCLVTPPGEVEALASAIRELWNDPARTGILAQAGLDFARQYCTEEATVAHVRSLLRRLNIVNDPSPTLAAGLAAV